MNCWMLTAASELRVELVTYGDGVRLNWAHSAEMNFRVPPPPLISIPARPGLN